MDCGESQEIVVLMKKKTFLHVLLGLCVSPNFRYFSQCFAEIFRAQCESAMLVHICGAPIASFRLDYEYEIEYEYDF